MENWIVVAAAGAGYVAQYLQSSSGDDYKDNLPVQKQVSTHEQSHTSNNFLHQVREKVCPFRRLARNKAEKHVSDVGVTPEPNKEHEEKEGQNVMSDGNGRLNDESSCAVRRKQEEYSSRNKDSCGSFTSTGLSDRLALLFMGITTGMMYAMNENRREIEKLNEKLDRTENLVRVLRDELEMQEQFTVDVYEKPESYSPTMSSSSEAQVNHLAAENHMSMSEIEAELEAELERLGMSIKVSTLETISDFVEIDSESEVDVAQGDLKLDCFSVQFHGSSESERDTSGTSTHYSKPVKYPVSPRELSLRLHKVIECRLEDRIKDLEKALYKSQGRACSFEAQYDLSQKDYITSESESSTNPRSPYCYHEGDG